MVDSIDIVPLFYTLAASTYDTNPPTLPSDERVSLTLGRALQQARMAKEWSQKDLATVSGYSVALTTHTHTHTHTSHTHTLYTHTLYTHTHTHCIHILHTHTLYEHTYICTMGFALGKTYNCPRVQIPYTLKPMIQI